MAIIVRESRACQISGCALIACAPAWIAFQTPGQTATVIRWFGNLPKFDQNGGFRSVVPDRGGFR